MAEWSRCVFGEGGRCGVGEGVELSDLNLIADTSEANANRREQDHDHKHHSIVWKKAFVGDDETNSSINSFIFAEDTCKHIYMSNSSNKILEWIIGIGAAYLLWEILTNEDDQIVTKRGAEVLNNKNLKQQVDEKIKEIKKGEGDQVLVDFVD